MQRFVAFLDILGFKNLVLNRNIDDMMEIMSDFKAAIDTANSVPLPDSISSGYSISLVKYTTFSDSIVLYTEGLEPHDFFRIVHVTKALVASSLLCRAPLRGAIAHGDFYADTENSIFFGDALIQAYEAEGRQQWSGAFVCDRSIEYAKNNYARIVDALTSMAYLIEYEIPFKLETHCSQYNMAVNWANMAPELDIQLESNIRTGYPFLSTSFDELLKEIENDSTLDESEKKNLVINLDRAQIGADVLSKWDNTKLFYQYAKNAGATPFRFSPRTR